MQKIDPIAETILKKINDLAHTSKDRILIAVDGRCCAGKTTLAGYISSKIECNVFHMDDFFLRPSQRTEERLAEPGGNSDRERFESEILAPLLRNENIEYRIFDCHTMTLQTPVIIHPKRINIVEGVYSCHPALFDKYDYHIFLDISKELQKKRIIQRNGEKQWEVFRDKWIRMEERYFREFDIQKKCVPFDNSSMTRSEYS